MFNVKEKSTFITGGTSGLGLAAATRLVQAGARVIITGRREEGDVIARNIGADFVQADLTNKDELINALEQAERKIGQIDILFNNAGIENAGPTIEESDGEEFQRIFDIDLKAPYNIIHYGAKYLNDGASVINTTSVAGILQMPGYSQYSAVKAGLISLTKTAALELAPRRIRVNAIAPGSIWSEMLPEDHPEVGIVKILCPQERIGNPEEVAALVHFLSSDDSRYISGAIINIDGGLSAGFGYPLFEKITYSPP